MCYNPSFIFEVTDTHEIHTQTCIQSKKKNHPRLQDADANQGRPRHTGQAPKKRQTQFNRLSCSLSAAISRWLCLGKKLPVSSKPLMMTIPKRVVRLSTRRSRLKRLIREAARVAVRLGRLEGPLHVVVRCAPPEGTKLADVQCALDELLTPKKS